MDALRFLVRRARRHWHILLTLSLGVILATALLASGPLLVDTVVELGLRLTFQSAAVTDANLRLVSAARLDEIGFQSADPGGFQALDGQARDLLHATLGRHLARVTWSAQSPWATLWVDGEPAADQRIRLHPYQGIADHLEYIAGAWPGQASAEPGTAAPPPGGVIRVVVSETMARTLALRAGDRLALSREPDSPAPDAWIEAAGIVRPRDALDPYWFGEHSPLAPQGTPDGGSGMGAIVPEDAFFPAVSALFPGDGVRLAWHVLLNHATFSAADIGPFQAQLAGLGAGLDALQPSLALHTGVPDILARFEAQLESIRIPIYILIAEVMLLALYFVTMIAALSMRQAEREFAIQRSRGATGWQIARIQLVEALIVVAAALLAGPWLGAGMVRALSWIGPLADLEQATWGPGPDQAAWIAAGTGALACLVCFLLPLRPALKRSIVTHQQMVARSTTPPWWQRYYLDVFALTGGLLLLWRLRLYGEMVTGGPGGARLDWLLLLAPVVLLLGTATILLRLFPMLLRLAASLAARGPGLEAPLALWQSARDPSHVTRLVLLLALAVALGVLSMGLNTTLDQSEYDRAAYLAGVDLRLVSRDAVPLLDLQSAPGVLRLSGVWRGQGVVDRGEADGSPPALRLEVLAIEPDSFSDVTTDRADFADRDMDDLLEALAIPEGEHPSLLLLPGRPASFGLWLAAPAEDRAEMNSYERWIDGDDALDRVGVMAKLQTAQGELFTARLHGPEVDLPVEHLTATVRVEGADLGVRIRIKPWREPWRYFEGALPDLPPSSYPLSLHSLWFENRATWLGEPIAHGAALVADDLTVVDAGTGEAQVVEGLEGPAPPLFLTTMDTGSRYVGLFTNLTGEVSHSGERGQMIYLAFVRPEQTYPLRLRQTWSSEPLPALASTDFMEATQLDVGDVVRATVASAEIDFRIAGTVRYFPTVYGEQPGGTLITARDLLLAVLNDTSQQSVNANEVLIETDGRTAVESLSPLVPGLEASWQGESVRKALKANPLALGLRAVTTFGSALTVLLSLVGFATHFYLSIRQQEVLYGVMRALGMSARQLYRWLVIEQAVLILAGLALGTVLGLLLNQVTLPRLPVSLDDRPPIPPFVPQTDWLALGGLYLLLAVALLLTPGIITALLRRADIDRILRIGQE